MRKFRASVHHLRAPDPVVAARRVQREIGADIATDLPTAEALVRSRAEAGRRALGGDPDVDAALLARREEIEAAAAIAPPLSDADVTELHRLADDLGRAARIRERTEARFAETLQARVAASTGLALHPAAVRDAADAVLAAEGTLASAEYALAALGPDPAEVGSSTERDRPHRAAPSSGELEGVDLEDLAAVAADVADVDDELLEEIAVEQERSRKRAFAVLVVAIGTGLLLVAILDVSAIGFVALVVVGVVLAILEIRRGRRAVRDVIELDVAADEQSDHLASVAAAVESTATGRAAAALAPPPLPDPREAWVESRARLDAARDEAEEELRVARNRWHRLAGPSADPHDAESVIRAHDPQLAFTDRAAETSPTVRTVAAFHRKAQARWKVLWAALGREHAPDPVDLDAVLEDVLGAHWRAVAEAAELAAADARVAAVAEVERPIVLAEPSQWLTDEQLEQLLVSVPPEGRVVVIERLDADEPAGPAGSNGDLPYSED